MDKRLTNKTLQNDPTLISNKLVSSPSFMENLSSTATILATVHVSQPNYVPGHLNVRFRISATLFTASMSKQDLMSALQDSDVVAIQPSQVTYPEDTR